MHIAGHVGPPRPNSRTFIEIVDAAAQSNLDADVQRYRTSANGEIDAACR
jgi:hypothetical protein